MKYKNIDLKWLGHDGFCIKSLSGKVIYIDPFKLPENSEEHETEEADYIFITHSHYDHCSIEDIKKIAKHGTIIVAPADVCSKLSHIDVNLDIVVAEESVKGSFQLDNIAYWPVLAYNINKTFHERAEDGVGYILEIDGVLIYHAGDTDLIPEMKKLSTANIDIALLPIGGTFTMNAGEAAKAASIIKPKLAIPMHYGTISKTGDKNQAAIFAKNCGMLSVEAKILDVGR